MTYDASMSRDATELKTALGEAGHRLTGPRLAVWDVVFGTRYLPADREPPRVVGIEGMPGFPRAWWPQILVPLRWRAVNSLLENGDSASAFYVYEAGGKLAVLSAVFDDALSEPQRADRVHEDPLFWAAENKLDRRIRDNPLLNARYREVMKKLLDSRLSAPRLRGMWSGLVRELATIE